jgi:MFS family permease
MTTDFSKKWFVLSSVAMGIFLGTIDGGIVNIAQPTLMRELSAPVSAVRWTVLAYMLTVAILMIPIGTLGDRFGKKHIYVSGFIVFTIASALCGMAPTLALLVAFRVLQGVGTAMMTSLGMAIVTENFPPRERGKALGITGTIVSIGIMSGPAIGGFVVQHFPWRSIFYVNIPIGIIGCYMAARFIKEQASHSKEPRGLRAMRNQLHILMPLAGAFVYFAITAGLNFVLPFYLEHVLSLASSQAGILMGITPIMLGAMAPISGILSDKFGTKRVTITGTSIATLGFLALIFIQPQTSAMGLVFFLIPSSLGLALFQTANYTAILSSVPKAQTGLTSSFIAFSRTLGFATGVGIFSSVFSWQISKYPFADSISQSPNGSAFFASIHYVFYWMSGFALLAAYFAVKSSKNTPKMEKET